MATELLQALNVDQQQAFDKINEGVQTDNGGCYFLTGPGGTGKTHVVKSLMHAARGRRQIVLACAMSGIAALNLPGGATAHSTFKIPVNNLDNSSMLNVKEQSDRTELLRRVSTIFLDEISMTHRDVFECIKRSLQLLWKERRSFGGVFTWETSDK